MYSFSVYAFMTCKDSNTFAVWPLHISLSMVLQITNLKNELWIYWFLIISKKIQDWSTRGKRRKQKKTRASFVMRGPLRGYGFETFWKQIFRFCSRRDNTRGIVRSRDGSLASPPGVGVRIFYFQIERRVPYFLSLSTVSRTRAKRR